MSLNNYSKISITFNQLMISEMMLKELTKEDKEFVYKFKSKKKVVWECLLTTFYEYKKTNNFFIKIFFLFACLIYLKEFNLIFFIILIINILDLFKKEYYKKEEDKKKYFINDDFRRN